MPKFSGLCEVLEVRGATLTLRELDSRKIFTASHDAVRDSTVSLLEEPQLAVLPTECRNSQYSEPICKDSKLGRTYNLHLFDESEWLPSADLRPPSLRDLDLTPPPSLRALQSQLPNNVRSQRRKQVPLRFVSTESSTATPPHVQNSQTTSSYKPNSERPNASTESIDCAADPSLYRLKQDLYSGVDNERFSEYKQSVLARTKVLSKRKNSIHAE